MITHGFVGQPGELRDPSVTVFGDWGGGVSLSGVQPGVFWSGGSDIFIHILGIF